MCKRSIALLAALCLLLCLLPQPVYAAASEALTAVYIPLDDRPFNDSQVLTLAESLDMTLIMPDENLYATKLDGETNSNGTQSGDRAALIEWLQLHAEDSPNLILSLDQLLSGGLMNSRTMEQLSPVTLSDGTIMTEYDIIDYIAELAETHTVYIIDSQLRLASSNGYLGYTLEDYNVTYLYGSVPRSVPAELTLEHVLAGYRSSADGGDALAAASMSESRRSWFSEACTVSGGTSSRLERYLSIRARKLRLGAYAVSTLTRLPNVHYLLGMDDSHAGSSIQTAELALLQSLSACPLENLTALDGLGQLAVASLYTDRFQSNTCYVSATYFGSTADQPFSYSVRTVREAVTQALSCFNTVLTEENPEISVLVLSDSAAEEARNAALYQLISQINENEAAQLPTIVILYPTLSDAQWQLLAQSTRPSMLLSLSADRDDVSRAVVGISEGLARYAALSRSDPLSDTAQNAFLSGLLNSWSISSYRHSSNASAMTGYLTDCGLSTGNFTSADSSLRCSISSELTTQVRAASSAVLQSFSGGSFLCALSPWSVGSCVSAEITGCRYPWQRTFEIECTASAHTGTDSSSLSVLQKGFVSGTSDTAFSPESNLTRDQAAALLVRAAAVARSACTDYAFADVEPYARVYVQTAWENGYISGYPDGTFHGTANITRAEFATMLVRYMAASGQTRESVGNLQFTDVPASGAWYSHNVYTLAEYGLVSGYPDGTFRPNGNITRAEAVAMLCRLFGYTGALPDSILAVPRFGDVTQQFWAYRYVQHASVSLFMQD